MVPIDFGVFCFEVYFPPDDILKDARHFKLTFNKDLNDRDTSVPVQ